MAIRKLIMSPDARLEMPCEKVIDFDQSLLQLIDDMFETMYEADGVGLAAPQVGIQKQITVIDIEDETGPLVLINPKIIVQNGEETDVEGCLSFPDLYGEVPRSIELTVEAQDETGDLFLLEAEGFLARVIQHEADHLHGVLFTSKAIRYLEESEIEGVVQE